MTQAPNQTVKAASCVASRPKQSRVTAPREQAPVGNQTHLRRLTPAPRMVQRDGPDVPLKEAKKEEAVDPIIGGVKEMRAAR